MNELKFDKKRSRVKTCPCGKDNRDGKFSPYAGFENAGYCHSCGKTFLPEISVSNNNSQGNAIRQDRQRFQPRFHVSGTQGKKQETETASIIPFDVFRASIESESENHFITYLRTLFDAETVLNLISRYYIGASKQWQGATVFYQIDIRGKIRAGKVMLYNPDNGHRVKDINPTWAHSVLKLKDFKLKQCFFGEHLLKSEPTKPVALCESEKTAIIASVYLPKFVWIAAGSKGGLNDEKCSVLKGRQVFLFPDTDAFNKWSEQAKKFSQITRFTVSDLLERKATEAERAQALDLADYLTRFDYSDFQQPNEPEPEQWDSKEALDEMVETCKDAGVKINPETWETDITELEKYFAAITLPTGWVKLNDFSTITDVSKFIDSHLETVKNNNGKRTFKPYLNRLFELKTILINLN